ncbi:MAG: InlB B-repeat-containing protein [Aquiluna sp.]|nr:InlB B-repeat-containing protein [Aquiluna sp.]MCF8545485.1 InlB B-repeat-containing protein [Aquiluna sp.]
MGKHAQRKSKARNLVASASAVSVSIGSLIAFAPASHAITCPGDSAELGMTSRTIDVSGQDVCELIFLPNGPVTWTPPSGVGKISALVIGGGSASAEIDVYRGTTYSAGGAGQVQYVDDLVEDLGAGPFAITAGPGQTVGGTGWSGASSLGASTTVTSAAGGVVQTESNVFAGVGYAWAGDSGNGYLGGKYTAYDTVDDPGVASGAGAGANGLAGSGWGDTAGGVGLTSEDLAADTDLWPASDTTQYGVGGSYFASYGNLIATSSIQGLGHGGSISPWGAGANEQPGANGSIRIRFSLDAATYTVTFNSNGGSSVPDGSFGAGGSVSAPSEPSKAGNTFAGWSTTLDDSETEVSFPYTPGVTEGITLYALWTEIPAVSYTVTFNSNGGSSVPDGSFGAGGSVSAPSEPSKAGNSFDGWSTTLDDSETEVSFPYTPGVTEGITLYALWTQEASTGGTSAITYVGPVGIRQSNPTNCAGDLATITGSRLGTIQNIYVQGADVPFTLLSDSRINFTVPNLRSGVYQLKYWIPVNGVTLTDTFTISSCKIAPADTSTEVDSGEGVPFRIAKRFTSYRGDRGAIVASDRNAITSFIRANPGLTHVTCVGSTSGKPASPSDRALAMARAQNACSVVKTLVPGVQTTLATSTGRGVGQFFRAVTLFGKGVREN